MQMCIYCVYHFVQAEKNVSCLLYHVLGSSCVTGLQGSVCSRDVMIPTSWVNEGKVDCNLVPRVFHIPASEGERCLRLS